ncbi:NAD(P)/FAD-dependent oxidoreductase [Rurimicrobium arvi]|uniref:NAD(P)/FAD-dependent oxidoreductase n=1 Tax=Rurimicrobium arvi TaxID=2049916 RepID=A0ABP8MQA2_9BACT
MKIAIIGAGAAGCFAAANIPANAGHEVRVFEKTGKALQKVKVSGGGRCNVTHNCFDIEELAARYPRGRQFLKKTLHRFGPADTIRWFESRGVQLKAESDGRMFPVTDDSQTIIDCIWKEMMRNGVQVQYNKSLNALESRPGGYTLRFADGSTYEADKVLVACGGFPKDEQYAWLRAIPQTIETPVPSLFTFNLPGNPVTSLMGIAAEVSLKIAGTKIREQGPLLITHWGFSGPAVLRCSAWAARELHDRNYTFTVLINWLKDKDDDTLRTDIKRLRTEEGKQLIDHKSPFGLPRRLWEYLLQESGVPEQTRWADLTAAPQNKMIENLLRQSFTVKGKTTFKEEFVTCGGVRLKDIDPATMQSRQHPSLYFAGEITDVDGITGGFNFQNAWTGAWIAAQSMVKEA